MPEQQSSRGAAMAVVTFKPHYDHNAVVVKIEHRPYCLFHPGGYIDGKDRSPAEAVYREVLAETGLDAQWWGVTFDPIANIWRTKCKKSHWVHLFKAAFPEETRETIKDKGGEDEIVLQVHRDRIRDRTKIFQEDGPHYLHYFYARLCDSIPPADIFSEMGDDLFGTPWRKKMGITEDDMVFPGDPRWKESFMT